MNDTAEESVSSGTSGVGQADSRLSATMTMPADGLNASLVKPTIETFHLSEIEGGTSDSASGFQNPGEVLHRAVIDAGGVHAGMQRIASGDFATTGADSSARDDQDIKREAVEDGETTEVNGQDLAVEAIPSDSAYQEPQIKTEEELPEVAINDNSPAEEFAGQQEPAPGFVEPRMPSVPEGIINEDLLKLLAHMTAKIEEEEDPEERVSLIEALMALIKMIIALSIKTAKEVGKDLLEQAAPKEI